MYAEYIHLLCHLRFALAKCSVMFDINSAAAFTSSLVQKGGQKQTQTVETSGVGRILTANGSGNRNRLASK